MIKYPSSIDEMIDKYKDLLSISDEPINLGCTLIDQPNQADIRWDSSSKTWFLRFNANVPMFALVHELGHIYFARKKSKYVYFACYRNDPEIDDRLYPLLNNLLDCFINYNLTLFNEIYHLYQAIVFEYLDQIEIFKEHIIHTKVPIVLLSWYILFFIDHNYLIKKQERAIRSNEMTQLRFYLKKQILQSSSEVDELILNTFTEKIKNFDNIKAINDPKTILNFFIDVLQATTLWDKSTLKKQVILSYPKIQL